MLILMDWPCSSLSSLVLTTHFSSQPCGLASWRLSRKQWRSPSSQPLDQLRDDSNWPTVDLCSHDVCYRHCGTMLLMTMTMMTYPMLNCVYPDVVFVLVSILCYQAEQRLINTISHSPFHVLEQLLPPALPQSYDFRKRPLFLSNWLQLSYQNDVCRQLLKLLYSFVLCLHYVYNSYYHHFHHCNCSLSIINKRIYTHTKIFHQPNKLAIVDYAHGAATWQTTQHTRHLWFWPTGSIMWKHDVIHKTRSTQHIADIKEDWAMTTGNTGRKFQKMFLDMQADKQRD